MENVTYLGLSCKIGCNKEIVKKYNLLFNLIGTEGMLIQFERWADENDLRSLIHEIENNLKPKIEFHEISNNSQKLRYAVTYSIGQIHIGGEITFYNDGRCDNPKIEICEFADEKSEEYWEKNWESIKMQIFDLIP